MVRLSHYALKISSDLQTLVTRVTTTKNIPISTLIRNTIMYTLENHINLACLPEDIPIPDNEYITDTVAFVALSQLMKEFDKYAKRFGMNRSEAIRRALMYYILAVLEPYRQNKTIPKARIEKSRI